MTGWNTKLDARASNYGSRIDYILVTPSLLPWIAHSDIQQDVYGSDHCPVYVDLHEAITGEDGKEVLLRDLVNPPILSPQHAHNGSLEGGRPDPPAMATRFWDEYSGKQTSLKDFFGKKAAPKNLAEGKPAATAINRAPKGRVVVEAQRRNRQRSTSENAGKVASSTSGLDVRPINDRDPAQAVQHTLDVNLADAAAAISAPKASASAAPPLAPANSGADEEIIDLTNSTETSPVKPKRKGSLMVQSTREKKLRKITSTNTEAQPDLASFFRSPTQSLPRSRAPSSVTSPMSVEIVSKTEEEEADYQYAKALASAEEYIEEGEDAGERSEAARRTWSNIFAKKVAPRCRVHNLPCKAFGKSGHSSRSSSAFDGFLRPHPSLVTKISGKNKGKKFWLCSK